MNNLKFRNGLILLFTFAVITTSSCNRKRIENKETPKVEEKYLEKITKQFLNFSPRLPGTELSKQSVDFLATELSQYDVTSVERQTFNKPTPLGATKFTNLIVDITGETKEYIIIGAHYDTKYLPHIKKFYGANDGGSGVAALMSIIKTIKESKEKPYYSLKFIFFDGEECYESYTDNDGLCGSKYLAQDLKSKGKLDSCKGMILLDMIGDKDLMLSIPQNTDEQLRALAHKGAKTLSMEGNIKNYNKGVLDDFVPFQKLGVKCIDLIDFEFGPNNVFWHTSEDTIDKLDYTNMKKVADLTLYMIYNFDNI